MRDPESMADKPNLVHVQIFGQTYAVKAGADPGYVERLAAFVDAQMTEVSRGTGAVDSVRVAVLAALNIADEVFRLREEVERAGDGYARRAASLAKQLGAALGE
jgi:cell division protein ZapA